MANPPPPPPRGPARDPPRLSIRAGEPLTHLYLDFEPPAHAQSIDAPPLEVPSAAGVRALEVRRFGVKGSDAWFEIGCVSAPSARWVPGAEELVLDRATQLTRARVPDLDRLDGGPIEKWEHGFSEALTGSDKSGATVAGKHMLTFSSEDDLAILCTSICRGSPSICEAPIASMKWDTENFTTEPPGPGILGRAILFAGEEPKFAGIAFAMLALALISVVIARRPKPLP